MNDEAARTTLIVVVATFDNVSQASATMRQLEATREAAEAELVDVAVVVRKDDGKVEFVESADPGGKTWGKRAAVAGGLVGLLFPPSVLAGAAVGAVGGGLWGKLRDKGQFKDGDLKAIGESLAPGSSALLAVAEEGAIERLDNTLQGYVRLSHQVMGPDASAAVLAEAAGAPA